MIVARVDEKSEKGNDETGRNAGRARNRQNKNEKHTKTWSNDQDGESTEQGKLTEAKRTEKKEKGRRIMKKCK